MELNEKERQFIFNYCDKMSVTEIAEALNLEVNEALFKVIDFCKIGKIKRKPKNVNKVTFSRIEYNIMKLLLNGYDNNEIQEELGFKTSSLFYWFGKIMQKTGIKKIRHNVPTMEIALWYLENVCSVDVKREMWNNEK